MNHASLIPLERVGHAILIVRKQKVILDHDLAALYGVTTTRLNQQVHRNLHRFPSDFSFILTQKEYKSLMLQIATSKSGRGGRRKPQRAFTEHGAIMAACVLNSPLAVTASIYVVRAFVRLREVLASHKDLTQKLEELEAKFVGHDEKIREIFEAIRALMYPPVPRNKRRIGFRLDP